MFKEFDCCTICPRECRVNRNAGITGYCGSDSGFHIASIVLHHGEEPAISGKNGICNVFFSGCNLRCTFCQNYQISRKSCHSKPSIPEHIIEKIIKCLQQGAHAIGFVTPSHFIPHVIEIINRVKGLGFEPVMVYNTNAYDRVEMLKSLEGRIDVYLPDFKYLDSALAGRYSGAPDYPAVARKALKEMYRQKGTTVVLDDQGQAATGLIIRHLVLPGSSQDSIRVLRWIAEELSTDLYISLMSQYYPTACAVSDSTLGRTITHEEYQDVKCALERLGFHRGWVQEYESHKNYRPDFIKDKPFE